MLEMTATPLISYILRYQKINPELAYGVLRGMAVKALEKNQANYISLFGISALRNIL